MKTYRKGDMVRGTVTGITSYGVFVTLPGHYSGLVHISELSYHFVHHIHDFVTLGDTIFVRILDVDDTRRRLRLNMKDVYPDMFFSNHGSKIEETEHGFLKLSYKLPIWIEESLKKLEKEGNSIDKEGVK